MMITMSLVGDEMTVYCQFIERSSFMSTARYVYGSRCQKDLQNFTAFLPCAQPLLPGPSFAIDRLHMAKFKDRSTRAAAGKQFFGAGQKLKKRAI
jgi:hypothetical protein